MARSVKNIIIGAGPAGLQLGYFFQKAGIDYVILERSEMAASFFDRYPLTGKLISINKKYTGSDVADFNLRHDWNSLLSDGGPLFTEYSKDYYPSNTDLVRYMNDYAKKFKLKIIYKTNVDQIRKANGGYTLSVTDSSGKRLYTCEKLIVATGLGVPNMKGIRDNSKKKPKHYSQFEKGSFQKPENLVQYENKSVLIIGNGNAAFELANLLNSHASNILINGKAHKPWAMSTHYTGDIRSVYLPFYDTFLLKSLNALDNLNNMDIIIEQETPDSPYTIYQDCKKCPVKHTYLEDSKGGWDHIILCTGWTFDTSIFDFELALTPNSKYPHIIPNRYESVNNENLFFIGSLMHSLDFKKSSGGFIHGFRYLIEYFFHYNYDRKFDTIMFSRKKINTLINHIIYRINYTSPLYQMYGQLVDIFMYNPKVDELVYINNVSPTFFGPDMRNEEFLYFFLSLEYSSGTPVTDIPMLGVRTTSKGTESKAVLLHPVLRVLKDTPTINRGIVDEIHFDEDILANFTGKDRYIDKLTRTLKMFIPA